MSSGHLRTTLKRLFSFSNGTVEKQGYSRSFSAPSKTSSLGDPTAVAEPQPEETKRVLIVGLGNYPAPRSRHSVGQFLLHQIAKKHNVELVNKRQCKSHIGSFHYHDYEVYLLKPKRFMNENGKCVHKATEHFRIPPSNVLLLHDELDLPLGKFRVKNGGSANGHNGVSDVHDRLHCSDMKRIRIGIGRPTNKNDVTDWVLGDFTKNERNLLAVMSDALVDLVYQTINIIVTPPVDLHEKLVEKLNQELEAAAPFEVAPVTPSPPSWSPTPDNARLPRHVTSTATSSDTLSTVIMLGALHKANYHTRRGPEAVTSSPSLSTGRRRYSNETINNPMVPYGDLDVRKDYNKRETKISRDCNKRVDYREYRRDRRYSDSSND